MGRLFLIRFHTPEEAKEVGGMEVGGMEVAFVNPKLGPTFPD